MSLKIKLKRVLVSPDFIIALFGAIIFTILMGKPASAEIVKEITLLAVSTLSIIFSVFFAALAVLITSGDNEFVKFLQKFGHYTEIIWSFKYTFFAIFVALLFSIILYVTSIFEVSKETPGVYPVLIMLPYIFCSLYALFCTVASAIDAIKYAEYRTKYLLAVNKTTKSKKRDDEDDD